MLTMTVHYERLRRRWLWLTLALVLASFLLGFGMAQGASVQLSWEHTQGVNPATGFIMERCTGATCTNFVAITPSPLPISVLVFNDTTIQPATSYQWRVRAVNAAGESAPSNAVTFRIPNAPPDSPVNLRGQIVP